MGKDYARAVDLDADEDNFTFRDQASIKELFPDRNEFLKYPKLEQEQEKLKQFVGIFKRDGEHLDPDFARFLKQVDGAKFWADHVFENKAHPTERGRTLLGDLVEAIKKIEEK